MLKLLQHDFHQRGTCERKRNSGHRDSVFSETLSLYLTECAITTTESKRTKDNGKDEFTNWVATRFSILYSAIKARKSHTEFVLSKALGKWPQCHVGNWQHPINSLHR